MRKAVWWSILAAFAATGVFFHIQSRADTPRRAMPAGASFRILLGVTDKEPAVWDGSIAVSQGAIASIQGWRFAETDSTDSVSSWKCSTRKLSMRWIGKSGPVSPNSGTMHENGVIVTTAADMPDSRFDVKTAHGDFSFTASGIEWGPAKPFLGGRVTVDRVPNVVPLSASPDDQDFPSIAQDSDSVYLSYIEFAHADPQVEAQPAPTVAPRNFDFLARPAGGDQVFLMRYTKSDRTWSAPIAVSAPRQDVARTAVSVDGEGRVWVFWSAGRNDNFDIYARALRKGRWSREERITSDLGTDLNPVAATDTKGRVWVAWQGYRKNNLEILIAAQKGDGFGAESVVSFSPRSDWDPSIAAAPNGEVSVAWDTYDKGDYDVYFRRVRMDGGIKMEPPVAVAVTANFEARSSIAYDAQSRLWVAYEFSDRKWGKDFGAYETTGVALYQDHNIQVKCFVGGSVEAPDGNLARALETGMGGAIRRSKKQSAALSLPDPQIAIGRTPSQPTAAPSLPLYSFPRIAVDPSGALYLTFRAPTGRGWLGSSWMQYLMYLDGDMWKGPINMPHTDYWLDARAAIAPIAPGDLLIVSAADHRQTAAPQDSSGSPLPLATFNADLYAAEFRLGAQENARVHAAPVEAAAAPGEPETAQERDQIRMMRDYRVALGSARLQVMRGEFHRHTEISGDGGEDGPLVDAYRYLIDAADMDWGGCCDHDNGAGREYTWWLIQKMTDAYHLGNRYVPMFSYERSRVYPEGHRNIVFAQRGIRPLPWMPTMAANSKPAPAPDTQMLYRYLKQFGGIAAAHTSGTDMGTDWRDNDPALEPVVEIYQGDRQSYEMPGAPRSNSAQDSIGGWRPLGFVSLALQKGYRLAFEASSDHTSTHMSYCNLWVTAPTREGIMEAFRKRRVYAATDNILADVRSGSHFMGEEFVTREQPAISVKLTGTANFAKVELVKDGRSVYSAQPHTKQVEFVWKDGVAVKGETSYYYVRGEQMDGELVWASPMWITYK